MILITYRLQEQECNHWIKGSGLSPQLGTCEATVSTFGLSCKKDWYKLESSGRPLNGWGTGTHYRRRGLENCIAQCGKESVSGLIAFF